MSDKNAGKQIVREAERQGESREIGQEATRYAEIKINMRTDRSAGSNESSKRKERKQEVKKNIE